MLPSVSSLFAFWGLASVSSGQIPNESHPNRISFAEKVQYVLEQRIFYFLLEEKTASRTGKRYTKHWGCAPSRAQMRAFSAGTLTFDNDTFRCLKKHACAALRHFYLSLSA